MGGRYFERALWGLVIVGIGVIFLLQQLDILPFDISWGYLFGTYWPLFLIIPGLRGLLFQRSYHWGQSFGNLIVLAIGVVFLLSNLDLLVIDWGDIFRFILPVGLILFGLSFLFQTKKAKSDRKYDYKKYDDEDEDYGFDHEYQKYDKYQDKYEEKYQDKYQDKYGDKYQGKYDSNYDDFRNYDYKQDFHAPPPPPPPKGDPYHYVYTDSPRKTVDKHSFIGDVHIGESVFWELQPLNISHFIGDTVIDLTNASIPYGETKINVSAFIGDVKIYIPQDLDVEVSVSASTFIGDQRVFNRRTEGMFGNTKLQTDYYPDAPCKLKINVSMFIGDTTIKKIG